MTGSFVCTKPFLDESELLFPPDNCVGGKSRVFVSRQCEGGGDGGWIVVVVVVVVDVVVVMVVMEVVGLGRTFAGGSPHESARTWRSRRGWWGDETVRLRP